MAERFDSIAYPDDVPVVEGVLSRCCETHPDWATLTRHILDDFSDLAIGDILRELRRAKDAVEQVALADQESLEIAELIVRHQLLMRTGHTREAARLDPERHVRPA